MIVLQPRDTNMDVTQALETQALLSGGGLPPREAAGSGLARPLAVAAAMLAVAVTLLTLDCRKLHFAIL
jgi:hypothetical protein